VAQPVKLIKKGHKKKNTLMIDQISWKQISEESSLLEIQTAISQTQEVLLANRLTLPQYKINIPFENSMYNLKKLERVVSTR
jgi:hypothetical protein